MLALNGADPLNGPRQWGSLLFCLVIVLRLQRAEGSTEETGSSYTKIRILPSHAHLSSLGSLPEAALAGFPRGSVPVCIPALVVYCHAYRINFIREELY